MGYIEVEKLLNTLITRFNGCFGHFLFVSARLFFQSLFSRLGTPALTSRGMNEADMKVVASLINEGVMLAVACQQSLTAPQNKLKDFKSALDSDQFKDQVLTIENKVKAFATPFPIPGHADVCRSGERDSVAKMIQG